MQESALNAIAEAFDHHRLDLRLFEPLKFRLAVISSPRLEYALYIFAATTETSALQ